MGDKLFRSDLYYRLKVFPITMPPLRDRPEDIPILARHFTKKYAAKMDRQIDKIPSDTMRALVNWRWPGNVRGFENFIERSVILSSGRSLRAPLAEIRPDAMPIASNTTLEQVEREHIIRVLRESGGRRESTARRRHRCVVSAETEEQLVPGGDVFIHACRETVPLEGARTRVEIVLNGSPRRRDIGQRIQAFQEIQPHRVHAIRGNDITRERRANEDRPAGDGRRGIIDRDRSALCVDSLRKSHRTRPKRRVLGALIIGEEGRAGERTGGSQATRVAEPGHGAMVSLRTDRDR
jgi:hypothetical protein